MTEDEGRGEMLGLVLKEQRLKTERAAYRRDLARNEAEASQLALEQLKADLRAKGVAV